MAFSSNDSGGPMASINVTPLVDVMLVLLIIFMITTPLMQHKIEVKLPNAVLSKKPDPPTQPPITVTVRANGDLFWNDEPVDQGERQGPIGERGERELAGGVLLERLEHDTAPRRGPHVLEFPAQGVPLTAAGDPPHHVITPAVLPPRRNRLR